MTWFKRGCLVLLCSFLFACGGGDDFNLGGDSGGGDDGETSSNIVISALLFDCNGDNASSDDLSTCIATDSVSYLSPGTLYLEVTEDNTPVSGETASISTSQGILSGNGTVLLREGSITPLSLSFDASQQAGAGSITVNYGEATSTLNFEILPTDQTPSAGTISLQAALYDCTGWDGSDINTCIGTTNSISLTKPGVIYVSAQEANGDPVENELVAVTSTVGEIIGNGSSLIIGGEALFDITTDITTSGAGVITATIGTESDNVNFQVGATDVDIAITKSIADDETLSNGSSMVVSVSLTTDGGDPYTESFETIFSSSCVDNGQATIDATVISNTGTASATYSPNSCNATDTIRATTNVGSLNATTQVDIETSNANSIEFVSAVPEYIVLQGSGGQESAVLTFKVVDSQNNPVAQQDVEFSLSTSIPGVALSQSSSTTNSQGEVTVTVNSGTVHGSVAVVASFTDPIDSSRIISTVSSNLVVSTGLPDNASFTVSMSRFNPEGWSYTDEEVSVTAYAADHFNHPVPDGTQVNFRTTGGVIIGDDNSGSCATSAGSCQVTWRSTSPKPANGRFKILAFVVGEEYFVDLDGDGQYQITDAFPLVLNDKYSTVNDIPEWYVDVDGDDSYTQGVDEPLDFNSNGIRDLANGIYNGSLCSDSAEAASQCTKDLLYLGRESTLVMSGSNAFFTVTNGGTPVNIGDTVDVSAGTVSLTVTIEDLNGNSMPGATTISASTNNGEIKFGSSIIVADNVLDPTSYSLVVGADDTPGELDTLTISVSTPRGNTTEFYFNVQD